MGLAIGILPLSCSHPEQQGFSRSWSGFFQFWQWRDSHNIGISFGVQSNNDNVGVAIEIVALSRSQPEWHGFSRSWSGFFQLWQWDDSHDIDLSSSVLGNIDNMGLAVGILPLSCSHPELQGFSRSWSWSRQFAHFQVFHNIE